MHYKQDESKFVANLEDDEFQIVGSGAAPENGMVCCLLTKLHLFKALVGIPCRICDGLKE